MKNVQYTVIPSDIEEKKQEEEVADDTPVAKLSGEDPPEPGAIYIISREDSSEVITNDNGKIILSTYEGTPLKTQKWVCHRSNGWLGFANDAGNDTVYLGHGSQGILRCTSTSQRAWENFCVRKRAEKGFEILLTHWGNLQFLADRGDGSYGKQETSNTWWNFTEV